VSSALLRQAALGLVLTLSLAPFARPSDAVDVAELTRETQRVYQDAQVLQMVWWIPPELWSQWARTAGYSATQAEQAVGPLESNTVVFISEGQVSAAGPPAFKSADDLRKRVRIRDASEKEYRPLPSSEVAPDIQLMLTTMQPAFARALGPAGEHLHAFVFAPATPQDPPIASAGDEGSFTVEIDARPFRYRLPLAALLPRRFCPIDREALSGDFKFCPYHGVPLQTQSQPPAARAPQPAPSAP
jgi:hypothetical protein